MDNLKEIISKNIISLRKANHMTQSELAEKLSYSDKAISKWERAESIPDVIVLYKLAKIFNVNIDFLISLHENEKEIIKTLKGDLKTTYNKLYISVLATSPVWIIVTLIFCIVAMITGKYLWISFVVGVPVCAIILLVFNTLWGNKKYNYIIISILVWTILVTIYLFFLNKNIWEIFLIGIPIQIIILLWSKLKNNI